MADIESPSPGGLTTTLISWIGHIVLRLLALITIRIPLMIYNVLSIQVTFTFSFTTLLLLLLTSGTLLAWVVRYRMFGNDSNLSSDQPQTGDNVEVIVPPFPSDPKLGYTEYLEQLFSGIFGYLEEPVLQELTNQLQTRKLIANEILHLDKETGFCLVGNGKVEILAKTKDADTDPSSDSESDLDSPIDSTYKGYRVLSEAHTGAPISSFFSILSLFTEDILLEEETGEPAIPAVPQPATPFGPQIHPQYAQVLAPARSLNSQQRSDDTEVSSTKENTSPSALFHDYSLQSPPYQASFPAYWTRQQQQQKPKRSSVLAPLSSFVVGGQDHGSVHPDIIARAVEPTTIAILPASSFHRLTRAHPKATAHIIQVILARFSRATLGTSQNYMGLISDVSRIERSINSFASIKLPDYLQDGALSRLKSRFSSEITKIPDGVSGQSIALHNPRTAHRRLPKQGLARDLALKRTHSRFRADVSPVLSPEDAYHRVSPGDLIGKTREDNLIVDMELRHRAERQTRTLANADSNVVSDIEEENEFRHAIMGSLCQALGISHESPLAARERCKSGCDTEKASRQDQEPDALPLEPKIQISANELNQAEVSSMISNPSATSQSTSTASHAVNEVLIDRLLDDVEIILYPKGTIIIEQGKRSSGLYYVIDGFIEVGNIGKPVVDSNTAHLGPRSRRCSYIVKPGGTIGYFGTLANHRSFSFYKAQSDVIVGLLPKASVERLVEAHPAVLLMIAKRLTTLLPQTLLHVDFALEWIHCSAGETLFRKGTESDAIYIVLNGRLRAIATTTEDGKERNKLHDEYSQGDSIGELEVITDELRPSSLHAIRDSELVKLPKSLFNFLSLAHPSVSLSISRTIARRMQRLIAVNSNRIPKKLPNLDLRTVAIVPASAGVPVVEFATRLTAALIRTGTPNGVATLTQSTVHAHLGHHIFSKLSKLKLSQFLADLEERFGLVLYVVDTPPQSPWTSTCINKADCILLVGSAEEKPIIELYGSSLVTAPTTVKELVLLHDKPSPYSPGVSRRWLRPYPWISKTTHHHVEMSLRADTSNSGGTKLGDVFRQRVQLIQSQISRYTTKRIGSRLNTRGTVLDAFNFEGASNGQSGDSSAVAVDPVSQPRLYPEHNLHKSDFLRLARHLRGASIGLVLGGGGARGIAHVGILRAFEEEGIPIDIVGGTSIGALVGGLYASGGDAISTYGKTKQFAGKMNSLWRALLDLTYPVSAYTTGREFNRNIHKAFGNAQIEDFRLRFYCNSTNISNSRQEIHSSGYAWRYVRASMSLAGFLPPLCDDGRMLLDGGYVDNLTVERMSQLGASVIFAVDVGSQDDQTPQTYGDSLSGFWAVLNRWNPFSGTPDPPSLSDIQSRLAYVSSVEALEKAKRMPGCHYLRPEIDGYGTLEFGNFEQIHAVGYRYGKKFVEELRQRGEVPGLLEEQGNWPMRRTTGRRASV